MDEVLVLIHTAVHTLFLNLINMLKRILSAGLAAAVIVFVVMVMTTSADNENGEKKGFNFNPENRDAIMQAIEDEDYNTWYSLMTAEGREPKILEYINENNFNRFSEMYDYMKKADEIRDELGLPQGAMGPMGNRAFGHQNKGMLGNKLLKNNSAVTAALENGDYNAFVEAMTVNGKTPKMLEYVTEANFDKYVEMHDLLKEGKKEEAKAIADELGLPNQGVNRLKMKFGQWKNR